ncbi:TIGR01777 family oxidoreductase [Ornithinibacillus halotolerans]|uniref:Epimerase n=1 Tax=Ornithinibacillus halotolerans TaxID=1274357 RepID=A0A916S8P2_9BACI|nr:TIGR01777 family oxidoreductase [Ornithinibacillus halotolerans]GGA89248.1 epimerase [Ornithinibacillus halotolerans]
MNILISGGTGFVGSKLVEQLSSLGHHSYILTRTPNTFSNTKRTFYISYSNTMDLPPIDVVINLAGESLYGYWTKTKKEKIKSSRIESTKFLVELMSKMKKKPEVFISGSAVGYYGTSDEKIFTENTVEPGNDFLADVVVEWENTAKEAEKLDIRTVFARFGVILGMDGGALPLMALPTKLYFGGRIGNGNQWTSWVHIQDAVDLIIYVINKKSIQGALNVTAPNPLRNQEFNQILSKSLKRPYWFPTPGAIIRIATGEMSQLVLKGQYVLPKKALNEGFQFTYPTLELALHQCFQRVKKN